MDWENEVKHHEIRPDHTLCLQSFGLNGLTTSNSIFTQNMLERTTKIGSPIGHASTCVIDLSFAKKVKPLQNLFNNFLTKNLFNKFFLTKRLKLL